MRRVMHLVVAVIASAVMVGGTAVWAGNAPPVAPHRHFLVLPDGSLLPVGPQVCEKPSLQGAFNEFHSHIHVGPANDAFDHDHNPVNITARGC